MQRVIVTRPQQEATKWVDALAQAGFDAQALPLIAIEPAPDEQAVRAAWARMHNLDAVMFVSSNAVEQFYALKPAAALMDSAQAATKTRAFVTGPGSLAALQRAGVDADWIDCPSHEAGQFDSEALWGVVASRVVPGYRVLIVRGTEEQRGAGAQPSGVSQGVGRDWFANQVRHAGGSVEFVVSYVRCPPRLTQAQHALVADAAGDGSVWLFSSSEAVANLLAACPQQRWSRARAVATHPRIERAVRDAGFAVVCASRPAMADLVASIESLA